MINPQAGAYVGNSLYLKCLMYTCVISTYILNILTYWIGSEYVRVHQGPYIGLFVSLLKEKNYFTY